MDMQALLNAMSDGWRRDRSKYHVTLGRMIEAMKQANPDAVVSLDFGGHPGGPISYRGYYADLAFEPSNEPITARAFLKVCQESLGKTFEGYKGGDFLMGEDAPLWSASYGTSSDGRAIVDVVQQPDRVVLKTKVVE